MIFTWCSRDHIPASRSTINPRSTRGFHVVFTWFSRGVYGIKKFRPLDQQLTLERVRIFPLLFCLGQIPIFSQIPGYFQNHAFFHLWTNPGLFSKITTFSKITLFFKNHTFWTNPGFFKITRFFHLWTNLKFCFGQIPDFTLSRDFTFDKFRILHYPGILPWTNPEFCTLGEIRTILKLPCF